jgi:sugar lactone lactonase YvrE
VQNELGEGPLWHSRENALYWADIGRAEVFRFRPDTGVRNRFPHDTVVSALGIWTHRKFVAATENGFEVWSSDNSQLAPIAHFIERQSEVRMNDGGVGPGGRFWAGLLRESRTDGGLYRLGPNGRVSESEIEVVTPNGLDWAPGGDVMYLTDS